MPHFESYISSKLPHQGTTIFTIMSALANEHNALNLSQGFPQDQPPKKLISLVNQYMKSGHNQYAPMAGLMSLREKLAEKVENLYGTSYNPETEITITAGGTQAINAAITALIKEGDEVVIIQPAYDCYVPTIELTGGKPIFVDLETDDYSVNWEQFKKIISSRTKMIIINTPHNPTGALFSDEDMKELEKITNGSDIIILSDEVYEHLVYDGEPHQSVMRYPGLANRSIVVFSFGKTYNCTGWKVGYAMAPPNLTKEIRRIHQFQVFSVNTPVQHALSDILDDDSIYEKLKISLQQKRDTFLSAIESSNFTFEPSKSTYFQLASYANITDEADVDYAKRLTTEFGIASIPISVFYHNNRDEKILRFCFAKDEEMLKKAGDILCKI